jgi:hypothetical protein
MYLVELEWDDDAEAQREPKGRVEQEERFPPTLAPVRGQPRVLPCATAAASGLPSRRPPRSCKRRGGDTGEPGTPSGGTPSYERGHGTHLPSTAASASASALDAAHDRGRSGEWHLSRVWAV